MYCTSLNPLEKLVIIPRVYPTEGTVDRSPAPRTRSVPMKISFMRGCRPVPSANELITVDDAISRSQHAARRPRLMWLLYCKQAGNEKAQASLMSYLTSFGVVSYVFPLWALLLRDPFSIPSLPRALLAALFLAGIEQPPEATTKPENLDDLDVKLNAYIGCAAVAFILNLGNVLLTVLMGSYCNLYCTEEFHIFIYHHFVAVVVMPGTCLSVSVLLGLLSVFFRLNMVFLPVISWLYLALVLALTVIILGIMLPNMETRMQKVREAAFQARQNDTSDGVSLELSMAPQ